MFFWICWISSFRCKASSKCPLFKRSHFVELFTKIKWIKFGCDSLLHTYTHIATIAAVCVTTIIMAFSLNPKPNMNASLCLHLQAKRIHLISSLKSTTQSVCCVYFATCFHSRCSWIWLTKTEQFIDWTEKLLHWKSFFAGSVTFWVPLETILNRNI